MTINSDMFEANKEIDRLLRERRPDRYTVRGHEDDRTDLDVDEVETNAWLDAIAADVEHLIPEATMRRLYARSLVGQREGGATRNGNKALRDIDLTGQEPLTWDWLDEPIAVVSRVIQPGGRVKVIEERVALRAANPKDLQDFATEERRRAGKDFTTRNFTCEKAEALAEQMIASGSRDLGSWAEGNGQAAS